jgi:hypothetical protein
VGVGAGAVFLLQRMAERDGGVHPSECPNSTNADYPIRAVITKRSGFPGFARPSQTDQELRVLSPEFLSP